MGFRRNMKQKSFPIVKSIKFYSFDVKAIATKQSRVTFCENSQKKRNVITQKFYFVTLMKANHTIFKMDPYYPKTLLATFLNYMNQRQEDITSQI